MARMTLGLRRALRLAAAVLALALLAAAVTSGSALARVAGGASPQVSEDKAPKVTLQPASVTVEEGHSAMLEASASGTPTPTVSWEVSSNGSSWSAVAGADADQLTIADPVTAESGHQFRAVFANAAGHATSKAATLTVQPAPKAPQFLEQPTNTTVEEGHTASFFIASSGYPTPTVQWEVSTNGGAGWSAIAGAGSPTLSLADVQGSQNGYEYRAVLENVAGTATSNAATLAVHTLPVVSEQPLSMTVEVGRPAVFEAAASGFPTPTVQWEVSTNAGGAWSAVAGADSDQLTVSDAQVSENGDQYRAVFTNVAGKGTSEAATLTVASHHYRVLDWGQNTYGQLGDGGFAQSDVPVPASGLNFVTSVAAGKRHTLALLSNETADAWGSNMSGQLGRGEGSLSDLPVAVEGLAGAKALAAGANHSLALLGNGTVVAWGGDESGQLGDGATIESDAPVRVSGLSGVVAIAAGNEYSLALLGDGTVMAWGDDEKGQLGDGKLARSDVPVAVSGLSGVTAIAAGGEHALALLSDGTVMAWGDDEYGQLGNSSVPVHGEEGEEQTRFSDVPVAVDELSGVTAIAAGLHHSLALSSAGTVMAWGEDAAGELGDGSIAREAEAPVPVSGLSGVSAIAAGGEHSIALLASGNVATWGEGKFGELGNGTAGEPSDVPVAVSGLGEVKAIAAGASHDVALSEPLPSVTAVGPRKGPTTGATAVTIVGTSFEGATAVAFGTNAAAHFTVTSPSSITAVAPAGALGTVNVTVTTAAGTSAPVVADQFSYVAAPTIKSLSPKSGPGAGETSVTITGKAFEEVAAVDFAATPATHFTVNSPTSITAVAPAGAGTVEVTVTTPGGTSAASSKDQFEYVPAVAGVSPDTGTVAGGTSVTITGTGFALGSSATTFKVGKKYATSVQCASTTSCTAVSPAGKAGTVDVIAAVGKAKSAANAPADEFIYE
jgi:alpha-tubulin suppressor-like RCC1 family protein